MKRRRLWAIGILLLLIPALYIFGPQPEKPPFAFLEGAELRYVNVSGGICTTSYWVDGDQLAVVKKAGPELAGWTKVRSSSLDSLEHRNGARSVTVVGWEFGTPEAPMTHVLVERPAVVGDLPRSWASTIRSWLP